MGIRVLLCFRIHLLAEGLAKLLEEDREIECLGIARTGTDLERLLPAGPDVIVAEEASLGELMAEREEPVRNIILVSGHSFSGKRFGELQELVANGLAGILLEEATAGSLRKAVRAVHAGELWLDHKTIRSSFCRAGRQALEVGLTRREEEILSCLCQGFSNKEIAARLFISPQTVKSHCKSLYRKFAVSGRLKLVALAREMPPGRSSSGR